MASVCKSSGTSILSRTIKTPLGCYLVEVCGDGAHSVNHQDPYRTIQVPDHGSATLAKNPVTLMDATVNDKSNWKNVGSGKDPNAVLARMVEWFHLYFTNLSDQEKSFPAPFNICVPDATVLQKKIWKALQDNVGVGSTISYGELAKLVEKPKAARAVGSAMRNNPNILIVPCHRVVRADKVIGNYGGGSSGSVIKRWLLDHEKMMKDGSYDECSKNGVAA